MSLKNISVGFGFVGLLHFFVFLHTLFLLFICLFLDSIVIDYLLYRVVHRPGAIIVQ